MKKTIIIVSIFLIPYFVSGQLLLNEISSVRGYEDSNGKDCDWLEIVNIGSSPIDLSNYFLSDDLSNLDKWNLPEEYLDSMQHMLVLCSGLNKRYRVRNWQSIINRSSPWHYILGNSEPDSNWKSPLYTDTAWSVGYMGRRFGKNNDRALISGVSSFYLRTNFIVSNLSSIQKLILHADYDDAFIAYLNGVEIARSINIHGQPNDKSLAISEEEALVYRNLSYEKYIIDNRLIDSVLIVGENVLAIEVHCVDSISDDMRARFYLHAGINSDSTYFNLQANWFEDILTLYHANFKISNNETIYISDAAGNILDQKSITTNRSLISEGRCPSGIGSWCYFENPSPGLSNNINWCYNGISEEPNISLTSGWYTSSQYLTIDVPKNSTVYYTLNGDVPDTNDYKYTDTLWFDSTTVLSVRAFSNNLLPSKVIDRTFFLNEENFGLPVFSIITDSLNLWDWNKGIYVYGPGSSSKYPYLGSNFWKKWSMWSRLEFFDENKNKQAEEEFDLAIAGGWSRGQPQKSFSLDFKSRYSGDFDWPIFSDKPHISKFNNIILRNGGNVARRSKLEDALGCKIAMGTNVDVVGYEPCILYLNGEYWGIYGIREKKDKRYIQDNHSVNKDSVDLIFGKNSDFNNLLFSNFSSSMKFINSYYEIMNSNPTSNHFFNLIDSIFDIRNYIDYFILQTYFSNSDWICYGGNNVKLWRPAAPGGKWRYILYDVDAGFKGVKQNTLYETLNTQKYSKHSQLFKQFLQNNEFKSRFYKRYFHLLNTNLSHINITKKINLLKNQIEKAMPNQIERWFPPEIPRTFRDTNAITSILDWYKTIDVILNFSSLRQSHILNYLEQ
ncbi:MAG: CotH kinase family protein [Saprospiraceae bacterium]|nr:CotH kinase family protein [Saprospiraceae bacterium]